MVQCLICLVWCFTGSYVLFKVYEDIAFLAAGDEIDYSIRVVKQCIFIFVAYFIQMFYIIH